ncbi:FG-GAP repeat protein [Streptomyces sp. NPDC058691]|uniref:FG-GAP repeat protein n=1 Tax=Streptomyces sp. NPDC058691 TaxID=3346601 RepID=UPI0036536013
MRTTRPLGGFRTSAAALATTLLATGACITAATAPATAAPAPAARVAHDDFNGDGYSDLVVSAPGGTISKAPGAGYVAVLYGSAKGYSPSRRATFSSSTPGIAGIAAAGDRFGKSTASGDLDDDGYADLVVGIPGKDVAGMADAGAAVVLWGSKSGLQTAGSSWLQDGTPKARGGFGVGLAAGRFTGEDTQLAVMTNSTVWTYHGDATAARRLTPSDHAVFSWWDEDYLAGGLTSGDYNNDGADDVVLLGTSIVEEGIIPAESYGVGRLLSGGPGGLAYSRSMRGGATGASGASGDINHDGYSDLVLGSPGDRDELNDVYFDGGSVRVYLGGPNGPAKEGASGSQVWTQNTAGVPGTEQNADFFGAAVSLGDIDGDGYLDAAVGAPGNDIGKATDAGTIWVFRGSATGLTTKGIHTYGQDSYRVPGTPEKKDAFGSALRLVDGNRDRKADLAAGAPGEDTNDGGVWVLPGASGGLATDRSFSFNGATLHAPSPDARVGESLAP